MRISDWSSDVCSSDLVVVQDAGGCFALHVADAIIEQAVSPAGEPRDTLRFERASAIAVPGHAQPLFDLAALARAMTMAGDRKSTRLNSSHQCATRMPSSA